MKISNFKFQIPASLKLQPGESNFQKGFTLIELLASTIVIVTVGVIIVGIVVSSLRGTNKTNTISVSRQNGTYAIAQISKMLRFAQSVDAVDGGSPSVCIVGITPTPQSQLVGYNSITFTSVDGGTTTIACKKLSELSPTPNPAPDPNEPETIASNGASLLDTSIVQIPPGRCKITCNQSTVSDAMSIGINFSLESRRPTGVVLLPEFTASSSAIEFNTSLILRNVGR